MGRPRKNDNRYKFTTTIEKDLIENIKIMAIKENRDVNDILEQLIKQYLNI